ncbi:MAG: hypothetical protein ACRC8A_06070 [Microcoleaceae cyanobacterium]
MVSFSSPSQPAPKLLPPIPTAAVLVSLGLHALIGFNIEKFPLYSETAKLPPTVELIELNPRQVEGIYPEQTRLVPSPFEIPASLPVFGSGPSSFGPSSITPPPPSTLPSYDFTPFIPGETSDPVDPLDPNDFFTPQTPLPDEPLTGYPLPSFPPPFPPNPGNPPSSPPLPVNPWEEWLRSMLPKYPELKGIGIVKGGATACEVGASNSARVGIVVGSDGNILAGPVVLERTGNEELDTQVVGEVQKFLANLPASERPKPYGAYGFEFQFSRVGCSEGLTPPETPTQPPVVPPNPEPTEPPTPPIQDPIVPQPPSSETPGSSADQAQRRTAGIEGTSAYVNWVLSLQQNYPDLETAGLYTVTDAYPPEACSQQLAGLGLVGVLVGTGGEILAGPELLRSTGSSILDDEALGKVQEFPGEAASVPKAYQYAFEFSPETCRTPTAPSSTESSDPALPGSSSTPASEDEGSEGSSEAATSRDEDTFVEEIFESEGSSPATNNETSETLGTEDVDPDDNIDD